MNEETRGLDTDYIELAGDIVAAYVSNNHVAPADLPTLITSLHATIVGLASGGTAEAVADVEIEKPNAAQIRKSVQHGGIVSFIDGRSYKTLKRHLTAHGLTPEGYRTRYGLPAEYPMVAPSYSEQRSSLAKAIGLGVPGARAERSEEAPTGRRRVA